MSKPAKTADVVKQMEGKEGQEELAKVFRLWDRNENGLIEEKEMVELLSNIGVSDSQPELFGDDGKVTIDSFTKGISGMMSRKVNKNKLMKAFKAFQSPNDKANHLDIAVLHHFMEAYGKVGTAQFAEMIDAAGSACANDVMNFKVFSQDLSA